MHTRTLLSTLASALVLSTLVHAQTVELRGKVEDGEGACYYCPGFDFVIDGANFPITSSVVDLNDFMTLQIHAIGEWNHSLSTPVVDLVSVTLATETFSFGGGGKVGEDLDFTVHGTPGDLAFVAGSVGFGFLPALRSNSLFLLDLPSLTLVGSSVIGGGGETSITVGPVPALLSGLTLAGQALVLPADGSLATFTNADFKTIR